MISSYLDFYDTDGCMDIGICKEGFIFNNCRDGKSCTITKEHCIKNNNIWLEDIRSCDTRYNISNVKIRELFGNILVNITGKGYQNV